jgi:bifunctional non-homologous end joining protein LigD
VLAVRDPKTPPLKPAGIAGARKAVLQATATPSLATLVDQAPAGDDWLHEVKFDGYRIVAAVQGKRVKGQLALADHKRAKI